MYIRVTRSKPHKNNQYRNDIYFNVILCNSNNKEIESESCSKIPNGIQTVFSTISDQMSGIWSILKKNPELVTKDMCDHYLELVEFTGSFRDYDNAKKLVEKVIKERSL